MMSQRLVARRTRFAPFRAMFETAASFSPVSPLPDLASWRQGV